MFDNLSSQNFFLQHFFRMNFTWNILFMTVSISITCISLFYQLGDFGSNFTFNIFCTLFQYLNETHLCFFSGSFNESFLNALSSNREIGIVLGSGHTCNHDLQNLTCNFNTLQTNIFDNCWNVFFLLTLNGNEGLELIIPSVSMGEKCFGLAVFILEWNSEEENWFFISGEDDFIFITYFWH